MSLWCLQGQIILALVGSADSVTQGLTLFDNRHERFETEVKQSLTGKPILQQNKNRVLEQKIFTSLKFGLCMTIYISAT
jgi:hypothetical protein